MNVGTEWLVDAEGCGATLLCGVETVRMVCDEVVAGLGLRVVGEPMWHQFPQPGGVTGLYLLAESHLACHTFPETGLATFNLYCCRPRPPFAWEDRLGALLNASRVTVRSAARGGAGAAAGHDALEPSDHRTLEASEYANARDQDSNEAGGRDSFDTKASETTSAREVSSL